MTQSAVMQIDQRATAVIVALLLQTASVIWWASPMTRQVEGLQATDVELKKVKRNLTKKSLLQRVFGPR